MTEHQLQNKGSAALAEAIEHTTTTTTTKQKKNIHIYIYIKNQQKSEGMPPQALPLHQPSLNFSHSKNLLGDCDPAAAVVGC